MPIKPDAEITISLATAAMAYGTYQFFLPPVADIRSLEPGNKDIQAAERTAAWVSVGFVSLVAVLAKSPAVFILGNGTIVATSLATKHADQVSNVSKRASAMVPAPASGSDGVVGDPVAASQQIAATPTYGVAV